MAKADVEAANQAAIAQGKADLEAVLNLNNAKAYEGVPETVEEIAQAFEGGLIEFRGSPYDVIEKKALVGKPFVIADIRFYDGTWGPAVAVCALIEEGKDTSHVVFNDGSSGVFEQMKHAVGSTGRRGGFTCPKGLRASQYNYQPKDFDGKPIPDADLIPATTYYVA